MASAFEHDEKCESYAAQGPRLPVLPCLCATRRVVPSPFYDRTILVQVVVHHGRDGIKGCHCGWAELGKSHAEHVADVYEASIKLLYPRGRR